MLFSGDLSPRMAMPRSNGNSRAIQRADMLRFGPETPRSSSWIVRNQETNKGLIVHRYNCFAAPQAFRILLI
jgi:hypothetical protein